MSERIALYPSEAAARRFVQEQALKGLRVTVIKSSAVGSSDLRSSNVRILLSEESGTRSNGL